MENLVVNLVQNPVLYIGYFLSAVGAVGALLFFGGFFGGIGHLFSYDNDADHMDHARTRAVWGIYICMLTIGFWEFVRVIIGSAPPSYLWWALFFLTPLWIPWLYKLAFGKKPNGH